VNIETLLKPLFDEYDVAMEPAGESSLRLFAKRANDRNVPPHVTEQLTDFYSIVDGVPGLDSLDIHRCADLIIFEWWDQQELWLGQRDLNTLRWSLSKDRFCIGDASNVSFSPEEEYPTFGEALRHMVRIYDLPENT
ncbi:MAG TPA: hypothetical protein VLT32_11875, partial [Candidatus Sulfomarinibacteraceae bacterium]|nr:hypothetical protein [Candidatus Sulfomarinibacteraceae bacterium]